MIINKLEVAYLLAYSELWLIEASITANRWLIVLVANDYDPYSMSISDVG